MTYYQGDDINFSIDIKQVAGTDISDWSFFPSVVVYLYTHQSYIAKFRNGTHEGYGSLVLNNDATTYSGKLTPEQTRNMKGALKMSMRVTDEAGDISTKEIETGIRIAETPIKYEQYEQSRSI
jgi:hypothetical protein